MNGRGNSIWERAPRGGADAWDNGFAGQVVTEDFFGPPPPSGALDAVRFDASADRLDMPSAALPSGSGGWTVAGWFRIVNDRNAVSTLWSLDGVFSSSWHSLRTDATGTDLKLNQSGTDVLSVASLTVGVWYFVAVRKDAAGNVKAYVGTEAGGALSTVTGSVTNINPYSGDGYVGGNAYGNWLDGRGWGLRLWDVELSDAEVDAEFAASTAARTANLRAQWLLDAVPPTADSSGNSRTLTNTGGAWALEAGPTLPTSSGTNVNPAAVGVLTGVNAPALAATVTVGTAGVLTGVQTPSAAASISVGTTGVATGVNVVSTAAGVAVGTAGVLTGAQTPSTAAGVPIGTAGVLTGVNVVTTAAGVPVGAVGVLTGLNAPSVSASGSVSPSAVGVLTGLQTASLAAGVAPGAVGALTGVQTASLAAGTVPDLWVMPGQGWALALLVSQPAQATLLSAVQTQSVVTSSSGARVTFASSSLARAEKLDS